MRIPAGTADNIILRIVINLVYCACRSRHDPVGLTVRPAINNVFSAAAAQYITAFSAMYNIVAFAGVYHVPFIAAVNNVNSAASRIFIFSVT